MKTIQKIKKVKGIIALCLMLAMAASLGGPAMAVANGTGSGNENVPLEVSTQFNINNCGTGNDPLVKVKWEEEMAVTSLESGDENHQTLGTQIYPPLAQGVDKMITVCAIVADEQGLSTIATVKAWVKQPNSQPFCRADLGGPYVLTSQYNPETPTGSANAKARFQAADAIGLTTYNTAMGIDYAEVMQELNNGSAEVYCGDFPLNYEDPAGDYLVEVKAQDNDTNWGTLDNKFDYVAVAGFDVDFTNIDYGTITIGDEKMVDGNGIFSASDGLPTVRGIGNMKLNLTVEQDKMTLPLASDVSYAARMGNTSATKVPYNPDTMVTLPEILELSGVSKLDFWITVIQTDPNNTSDIYNGIMTLGCTPVGFTLCN